MRLSTIAFRNLARNKKRTVLSISTIVLACILGIFMLALVTGMKTDMKRNILAYYTGAIQIRHRDYGKYDYLNPVHLYVENEKEVRRELLKIEGVSQALGRTTAGGKIYIDDTPLDDEPGEEYIAVGMGINIDEEKNILDPGSLLIGGRLPLKGRRETIIGYKLAEKTGLGPGDKFSFMTATASRGVNAMTLEITGIVDFPMGSMNNTHFILPFDVMQDLMQMKGGAQEIIIMTEDPETAEIQLANIDKILSADSSLNYLDTALWKDQGDFYGMMGIAEITYNFMIIFFLLMGATVIINTTMMVIYERYREIGILGAMGMPPNDLVRLFFLESLFAGIISAVIGVSLGVIIILAAEKTGLDFSSAMGSMDMEVSNIIYPDLKAYHVILMTIYTIIISAMVTLIPCRKAATIEPVEAIRST
ncbi:MAG: ABC transporter permease [Spirochaetales bacterium]|nr:ABC transporter permease [Spirochaetales bacterium]